MKLWYLTKDYLFLAVEQLQNVIVLIVFMHLTWESSFGPNLKPLEINLKPIQMTNTHKNENAIAVFEMAKVGKIFELSSIATKL